MTFFNRRDACGRVHSLHNINTEYTWIIHKTRRTINRERAVDGKLKSNLEWPSIQLSIVQCSIFALLVQIIAEGANGPTTIAAERILQEKNALVIPVSYILCEKTTVLKISIVQK